MPRVLVTLPDQQVIEATLQGQWQASTGEWYCDLEIAVWAHGHLRDGRDIAEPAPVAFAAPAARVARIDGVTYADVPTRRHPRFTQPPADRWRVEELGLRPGFTDGPQRYLHHSSCWISPGPNDLSTVRARAIYATPGTAACPDCGAERRLKGG